MRYGSIRYVNNLPVDHGFISGAVPAPRGLDLEILPGHPETLNRALADGTIDASAISAAALDDIPDAVILSEAAIASHGPVESVLLISKVPFDQLDDKTIAVTDQSRTGALLLRILLERDVGIRPRYTTADGAIDDMLSNADAALAIGDQALRYTTIGHDTGDRHVLDLGEAWRVYTGLPMVYAVWATRQQYHDEHPEKVQALRKLLQKGRVWGKKNQQAILDEAFHRTGVPRERLATYYERLSYRLDGAEQEGLMRFLEEAKQLRSHATPTAQPKTAEVRTE